MTSAHISAFRGYRRLQQEDEPLLGIEEDMAERIRGGSIFRGPEGQARRRTQRHKVAQKYLADLNEVEAKILLSL